MIKIFTGCFRRRKHYPQELVQIAVCRWCPTHRGPWMRYLAPPKSMPETDNGETWGQLYHSHVLCNVTTAEIAKTITNLSNGRDVILLCYEEPGAFCHRRFLAEWLEAGLGIVVPEYGFPRDLLPLAAEAPNDHYDLEYSHWEHSCTRCATTSNIRLTDKQFSCSSCNHQNLVEWE